MADKSARKDTAKPAARSLKEKRLDKKEKAARTSFNEDVVSKVKKR
ncbi:hypothetical protein EDF46_1088 [Frondihabitans sp. PhB188]|nr:hypothetical protein [Frondihabitans sp. PhB188]ROQ39456.1 hypothetical protein EDF46_1088 [Frondihabitans sp. PhB188]